MVGDDGYTLDADREAYYRDTYSQCVNLPTRARVLHAAHWARAVSPEPGASEGTPSPPPPPSPIEICMGLFGSGRELEVAPEFEEYTHPTEPVECESFATQALCAAESSCTWVESPGVCKNNHYHGRFPYSCVCTGSDGLEFPEFNDEEFDPDSYNSELAGLCACGALARSARLVVGDAATEPAIPTMKTRVSGRVCERDNLCLGTPFCSCDTPIASECKDMNDFCPSYASPMNNYCDPSSENHAYMVENCKSHVGFAPFKQPRVTSGESARQIGLELRPIPMLCSSPTLRMPSFPLFRPPTPRRPV